VAKPNSVSQTQPDTMIEFVATSRVTFGGAVVQAGEKITVTEAHAAQLNRKHFTTVEEYAAMNQGQGEAIAPEEVGETNVAPEAPIGSTMNENEIHL